VEAGCEDGGGTAREAPRLGRSASSRICTCPVSRTQTRGMAGPSIVSAPRRYPGRDSTPVPDRAYQPPSPAAEPTRESSKPYAACYLSPVFCPLVQRCFATQGQSTGPTAKKETPRITFRFSEQMYTPYDPALFARLNGSVIRHPRRGSCLTPSKLANLMVNRDFRWQSE